MQEQLDTLESQLQEKEQLVAALTERLEQAAEQLDRLHRSGADRAMRVGGGFPPELVEQQKTLVEDLQRSVQQWEDMQPGAMLGRIEMQIAEIRDMLAGGASVDPGTYGGAASNDRSSSGGSDIARYMQEAMGGGSGASGLSGYEAMKAGLMANEPGAPPPVSEATQESEFQPEQMAQAFVPSGPEYEETPLAEPPASIDVANASIEDMRHAVEERDSYILYILQRLRNAESRHHVPNNWAVLESMPAELRVRLEVLEKQLQQTLRTAEVELSLQRAKLGREEMRIRHLDEQIQKELKRTGLNPQDLQNTESTDRAKNQSNRWMRMLGRGKGD